MDLERFIEERFVRASGPGGQNVNKVATAVELRFDVQASDLTQATKERLIRIAAKRLTGDGKLLIDSRAYRSQAQNREAARARLLTLIEQAQREPKKRHPTRPKRGARERRLQAKKRRGELKAERGRRGDE